MFTSTTGLSGQTFLEELIDTRLTMDFSQLVNNLMGAEGAIPYIKGGFRGRERGSLAEKNKLRKLDVIPYGN